MAAWNEQGTRLDIALAVALEVAVLRLNRAETDGERHEAIAFNSRLWGIAAALADRSPVAEDRHGLVQAASQVASYGGDAERIAGLNIAFARRLAGRAATGGALRQLLAEWKVFRATSSGFEFGQWLVDRLDSLVPVHDMRRAA